MTCFHGSNDIKYPQSQVKEVSKPLLCVECLQEAEIISPAKVV